MKKREHVEIKNKTKIFIACALLLGGLSFSSVAANAMSLDEAISEQTGVTSDIEQQEETTETNDTEDGIMVIDEQASGEVTEQQETTSSADDIANAFGVIFSEDAGGEVYTDVLEEQTDYNTTQAGVRTFTDGIKIILSWILQIIAYLAIGLTTLRVVLDIFYIAVPFMRNIMAPDAVQKQAGSAPNGTPAAQMNSGNSRPASASVFRQIQWVSAEAIQAANNAQTDTGNGKVRGPFRQYFKSMTTTLIIVPIMLVLAISGVLSQLGFAIADALVDAISGLSSMV